MIIEYVREKETKRPVGVVVATGRDSFGASMCSPKDKWNKKLGLEIAEGRIGSYNMVDWDVFLNDKIPEEKRDIFKRTFNHVINRARKYYK